jgi:hypothetical protein
MARTIAEIIAAVDDVCPNAFEPAWKARWIGTLDGDIWDSIFLMAVQRDFKYGEKWPERAEWIPLIVDSHDTIYDFFLQSHIEFGNGEYEKFNNTSALFAAEFRRLKAWFTNRYHMERGHFDYEIDYRRVYT